MQRLAVVDCETLPWSITALSAASPAVPLTVGTSLGIHLHDPRSRTSVRDEIVETLDGLDHLGSGKSSSGGIYDLCLTTHHCRLMRHCRSLRP